MRVRFVTCAESVSLDARRNALSLFHLIEEMTVPAFPVVIPQLSIVALFERAEDEPELADLTVRIVLNEQEIFRGPIDLRFAGHLRMRWLTDVRGLVIPSPGTLAFIIYAGAQELGAWTISVLNIGQVVVQGELPLEVPPLDVVDAREPNEA